MTNEQRITSVKKELKIRELVAKLEVDIQVLDAATITLPESRVTDGSGLCCIRLEWDNHPGSGGRQTTLSGVSVSLPEGQVRRLLGCLASLIAGEKDALLEALEEMEKSR